MPTARIELYRRWFEYEKDSHRKVLASLRSVPEDRRDSDDFRKAVQLVGHIEAARRMWLYRFGAAAAPPASFFPTGLALEDLEASLDDTERTWTEHLRDLTEDELGHMFEYQSLDAGRFRSTVEDTLTQLFGHSWYHRGQVATLVRAAGGVPAVTDFVYWAREPVPQSAG